MIKEQYIIKNKQFSINILNNEVDSIKKSEISYNGLRIYKKGKIGVSGNIGKFDLEKVEKEAILNLKKNIPYTNKIEKNNNKHIDIRKEIYNSKEFIYKIEEVFKCLKDKNKDFYINGYSRMFEQKVYLKNTCGLDLSYKDNVLENVLMINNKYSNNMIDIAIEGISREKNLNLISDEITKICKSFNILDNVKEKYYPIIFLSDNPVILESLQYEFNPVIFTSGNSKVRKNGIFKSDLTLFTSRHYDDAVIPFFDAEGVICKNFKCELVKNGQVIRPYTDKHTAKLYNLDLTGGASALYDGIPYLGFQILKIKESDFTIKELLNGEKGIFIISVDGAVHKENGDIIIPVQLSFFFDGEKLVARLPKFNLKTSLYEIYSLAFRGISKNKINNLINQNCFVCDMKVEL